MDSIISKEEMTDMFGEGGAEEVISAYTSDQGIEDGFLMKLSKNIILTIGVYELKGKGFTGGKEEDYLFESKLVEAIQEEYNKQPTVSTDGGNDKDFFTVIWRGTKFFVARNETGGHTVMLPEEY